MWSERKVTNEGARVNLWFWRDIFLFVNVLVAVAKQELLKTSKLKICGPLLVAKKKEEFI
jgi:hypothetical protein